MAEDQKNVVWLTQDAYDKLSEELEFMKGEGRQQVSAKIAQARDEGDLSENGGYHAAREEQGQQEARIRQLEVMLRDAEIGEAPASSSTVEPGTRVTICYDGDTDDTDTFLLGSRELVGLADDVDIEVFSPQSPLGAAILGKKVGETATYEGPTGKSFEVQVLEIEPFTS
ncbi:transcription elongation factor GreA [Nigerium massiliense]|uniref:transcription elongation factor GreA n=1 Tax=Nigerium massiliense TaxID=1522317 RepID=UPI00059127C9|nr:transcription elongation factor GreA [Nigerium massiliense]